MLGMKAEIIAVGSELLTPDRIDTNSLFLTEELNKLGIEVLRKTIVGDNPEMLSQGVWGAFHLVSLVVARGGLGPRAAMRGPVRPAGPLLAVTNATCPP